MNNIELKRWIEADEINKDSILDEKFNDAIIGLNGKDFGAVYNLDKIIDIFIKEGNTVEEAIKKFEELRNDNTTFISLYNKENVDNHFWIKNIFNKKK